MVLFALPVPLASLVLSFIAVPSKSKQELAVVRREPFFEGCKQAVMNRSAVAALFVTMFSMAEGSISFYAIYIQIPICNNHCSKFYRNVGRQRSVGWRSSRRRLIGQSSRTKDSWNIYLFIRRCANVDFHFHAHFQLVLGVDCSSFLVCRNVIYSRWQFGYGAAS